MGRRSGTSDSRSAGPSQAVAKAGADVQGLQLASGAAAALAKLTDADGNNCAQRGISTAIGSPWKER